MADPVKDMTPEEAAKLVGEIIAAKPDKMIAQHTADILAKIKRDGYVSPEQARIIRERAPKAEKKA